MILERYVNIRRMSRLHAEARRRWMIATVPSWPARPLFRRVARWKNRAHAGADLLGRVLEVAGLVIFVTVLGTMPVIVAAFAG